MPPKQIFDDRSQFIDDELVKLEKAISSLQKEILEVLVIDYAPGFIEGLILNEESLKHLYELTPIFEELAQLNNTLETKIATNLLKLTEYSKDYFKELGFKVTGIKKEINVLYEVIGITEKGVIIPSGYLSKLFNTVNVEFQQSISNYVLNSIGGNMPYQDFVKGFREVIKGSPEVDGKLMKYYKQYSFDLYSKVAALTDNYYADQLGLSYFVYDGTQIDTSRPFCVGGHDSVFGGTFEPKIHKTFSKEEAESWNALDWKGKDNASTVMIARGGFNCRHLFRWITDDEAEIKKQNQ